VALAGAVTRKSELTVFYSPDYTAAAHGFDTTRKAAAIAKSLEQDPIAGVVMKAPEPLTAQQIARVHAPEYVRAVETGSPRELAESSGFDWDPGLWRAVCASNGGAVAAALHAFRSGTNAGSLSSGLHHAHRDTGAGFCTFNGLALAADALREAGASRIVIVDVDAHMGGGTSELVRDVPAVVHVDIAVAWGFDRYRPPQPPSSLSIVENAEDYLATIERSLHALDGTAFDVCLYNAGMDPHEDCDIGGLDGITADVLRERERRFFEWAAHRQLPVAFVLAGGYASAGLTNEAIVELHRLTIAAAVGVRDIAR
jgi:acetoin utilization deacetylase AcuC-like enzyme